MNSNDIKKVVMIMNSNIITNKTVWKTQKRILYFIIRIYWYSIYHIYNFITYNFESSSMPFKYATISEVHLLGFQMYFFGLTSTIITILLWFKMTFSSMKFVFIIVWNNF